MPADTTPPSDWLLRWAYLLTPGSSVLDLACGHGRHMRWLAGQGHHVTGVDKSLDALSGLTQLGEVIAADLESGPWPLSQRRFDCVLVTNYLWRPLLPTIIACVAPGGLLLYETFAQGNEHLGRPARADFLLAPGELLHACRGLHILAYENGTLDNPARCVQRIAAVRPRPEAETLPPRLQAAAS